MNLCINSASQLQRGAISAHKQSEQNRSCIYITLRSRDSAVGIATAYGLEDRSVGVLSPGGVKNFLSSTSSRPALEPTQSPIQWGTGDKEAGSESNDSSPASAELKKIWMYISTPPYTFVVHYLMKHAIDK
jgi:hypothetical protein